MDSSNSQEGKDTKLILSDKVAIISGLKKVGCDELSPQEWYDLFKVVFVYCKADIEYIPLFRFLEGDNSINCYFLKGTDEFVFDERTRWSEYKYRISDQMKSDPKIKALTRTKIVEICRMQLDDVNIVSAVLTNAGVICMTKLFEVNYEFFISDVDIIDDEKEVIKFFESYPQMGPSLVFAFVSMYRLTLAEKRRHIASLEKRSDILTEIRSRIQADGHTTFHFPWGQSDGSTNVFPKG
jgi:hypothetical protein